MATRSAIAQRIRRTIGLTTGVLIAAVPFAFSPTAYDQFRLVKEITVQILSVISIAAWALYILWQPAGAPAPWKRGLQGPLGVAIALSVIWSLINLAFAHDRGLGWDPFLNILLYAGLCTVLADVADIQLLKTVLYIALACSAANAVYGVAQYYGHDPLFQMDFEGTRVVGRHGTAGFLDNPNVAGAYFALTWVAGLGLLLIEVPRIRKGLIAAGLAVTLVGLVYTQTLAAMAGWIAGLLVWALFIYRYHKPARKYLAGALGLVVLATTVITLVNPGFRQRLLALKGYIQAGDWDTLLSRRYTIWATTVGMIKDRPLIGHGLGSHAALFFDYNIKAMRRSHVPPIREIAAEAHNEYLQIWAELGAIGLGLFLTVVGVYVRTQMRAIARPTPPLPERGTPRPKPAREPRAVAERNSKDYRILAIGSLAVLANVLINALANFPFHVAATASLTLVILALSLQTGPPDAGPSSRHAPAGPEKSGWRWLATVATVIVALSSITYLWRPYTASQIERQVFEIMQRIQSKGLARGESLRLILNRIEPMLDEAKARAPYNYDLYMLRGATYLWEGRYEQALAEYQASLRIRPTPEAYAALGRVYLSLKDPDRARAVYQRLLEFNPTWEMAQAGLAEAEALKKKSTADERR